MVWPLPARSRRTTTPITNTKPATWPVFGVSTVIEGGYRIPPTGIAGMVRRTVIAMCTLSHRTQAQFTRACALGDALGFSYIQWNR